MRYILALLLCLSLPGFALAGQVTGPVELKVATLAHGPWDLTAQRGKWVVVNYWATWCTPCLKEIPDLGALDAAHADIEVIGLAYEEIEAKDMQTFLIEHPAAYPVAIVDTFNPPAAFGTPRGLPTTFLVDPDGKIVEKFLGPITRAMLESAVDKQREARKAAKAD